MASPLIHVMHVLTDTNVGGAGTLLCNQLAAMDPQSFYFSVILPRGSRLAERIRALKTSCRILFTDHAADRSDDLRAIGEYLRIFRIHRPDIIHTHAALAARIAARLCHTPALIHTRHCVFPLTARQKSPLYHLVFGAVNHALSDGTIAVAKAAQEQLCALGMKEDRIRVIVNGVSPLRRCTEQEKTALRNALSIPHDAFIVGMMARLESYKGQGTLLDATARCLGMIDGERFYVLLCGDGSQKDALTRQAGALGISDHVRMVGFCEDVAPYYAIMDVNVNASYGTETSSLALSEGMSVGVPAVASAFGGNPAMVQTGVNGLLFPPQDAETLAEALLHLYHDRDALRRLSTGARLFYEQHLTARGMAEQLGAYYKEILAQKKHRIQTSPTLQ
ncbi:MAG: glycosyltransferase family 4 protein [Clostridia bacterium]|nr:glycosyltransferase family 4 protein [Clostridia bacterium]